MLATEGTEKWTKEPVNFSERLVGEMGAAFYIRYSVNIDADCSEYGNARVVSVKFRRFLDQLIDISYFVRILFHVCSS